ncbi:MAG: hypothetical protein Q4G10_04865 [Bacteroidia bacterium]|nr:hypothetical protein [Bacteroidia bacterium]
MRRLILTVICLAFVFGSYAQGLSERVFLMTDRHVYVAGDDIWCSAFCVDASDGKLSDFSSICYIGLCSTEGQVLSGKAALSGGRGSARLTIPKTVPTGNYRLYACTAIELSESEHSFCARTVSIINPYSNNRVKDGVKIVDEQEGSGLPADQDCGSVVVAVPSALKASSVASVSMINGGKDASVGVSVWRDDGIVAPRSAGVQDFKAAIGFGGQHPGGGQGEYEGEIIRGKVVGLEPGQLDGLIGHLAFIAAPGTQPDLYVSEIAEDGSVAFYTPNIFGDRELVCEVGGMEKDWNAHLELDSPFAAVTYDDISQLQLSSSMADRISSRAMASQVEKAFDADTLYDLLPFRNNVILSQSDAKRYVLDDYTRFPTMAEVITEFVTEMRTRKDAVGNTDLQVRVENLYQAWTFMTGQSLIMIDGVPVFDHKKVMDYDPLLVEYMDIYPNQYLIGGHAFSGVANLVTYKRNLPSVEFDNNVRIVDFIGASYPMAYTCRGLSDDYPDLRYTAYWHPDVDLKAGEEYGFEIKIPSVPGSYVVEVEGFDVDGAPIHTVSRFSVE